MRQAKISIPCLLLIADYVIEQIKANVQWLFGVNMSNIPSVSSLSVQGLEEHAERLLPKTGSLSESSQGFAAMLLGEMSKINSNDLAVKKEMASFNANEEGASIERLSFLMAKAEAELKVAVQVRNKAVGAYQEIMNMQI